MPMPTPTGEETRDEFVSRCMGDEKMGSEYPDEDQRYAVCSTQFSDAKKARAKALTHTSTLAEEEPDWEQIDKTQLPLKAFAWDAPETDEQQKSTWKYPHHFVMNGTMDDNGVFVSGDLFLHRGGLNAAWAAANGARSGNKAPAAVLAHLNAHRIDLEKDASSKCMKTPFHKRAVSDKIEAGEDGNGTISGYASVWDVVDQQGDIMRKGAFAKTIKERIAAGKVPLMIRHFAHGGDINEAIGEITSAKEDDYGLYITAKLYKTQPAQDAREKVRASPNMYGLSVGFNSTKNGAKKIETGYEFTDVALFEVTLTAMPAVIETNAEAKSQYEEMLAQMRAELDSVRAQLAKVLPPSPDSTAKTEEATGTHDSVAGDISGVKETTPPPRKNVSRALRMRLETIRLEMQK